MPFSTTSIFGEPDNFQAALCGTAQDNVGSLELFVTTCGRFRARLTQVELDHLRLVAVEEHLPRIGFQEAPVTKILVSFPTGDQPAPVWGGIRPRKGDFMTFGPGYRGHMRTDGPCRWCCIWFPAQDLLDYFRALTELPLILSPDAQLWHPPPAARRCLLQLHAAAIGVARRRPETIVDGEAAHGMEQQLIEALVECLSAGPADEEAAASRRHQEIMTRFEDLLRTQPKLRLPAEELAEAIGVSVRLLRLCCKEILGMSPTSYARLRALYRVRRILYGWDSGATTISRAARSQGFRALGRFAASYRLLFGQLPSVSLRQASHR
jgi:AraC-like DNA-binding protein